jgi:uncharacterized protein (DUF58 family)
VAGGMVCLFILSFIFPLLFILSKLFLFVFILIIFIDIWILFKGKSQIIARRILPEKLSNGDLNEIQIYVENHYPFRCAIKVVDEIPIQFQDRKTSFKLILESKETKKISYRLRPLKRGEYVFGELHAYTSGIFGLVAIQSSFEKGTMVPVYPSYLTMYKYELLAISNYLTEYGIKKVRRIGHSMEFEQIKNYVRGDDYRTVNWKASARRGELMVNHYSDEKSQQVYSIIDKGRLMKMPFNGLSLLDYAINTSLVISNIAIKKEDKTGLITFAENIDTFLLADKKNGQMFRIQEALYRQQTLYKESDFQRLHVQLKRRLNQRSLLILYTNFESLISMNRQKNYLAAIAQHHVLLIVFFENTELKQNTEKLARNTEEIYIQTVIEKFAYEKKQIIEELRRIGVYSVLTAPDKLTINTINKYLELKAMGTI